MIKTQEKAKRYISTAEQNFKDKKARKTTVLGEALSFCRHIGEASAVIDEAKRMGMQTEFPVPAGAVLAIKDRAIELYRAGAVPTRKHGVSAAVAVAMSDTEGNNHGDFIS